MSSAKIIRFVVAALLCAACLLAGHPAGAQTSGIKQQAGAAKEPPSLDGVAWEGPGASLADLKGKTTVLITYVTWCPKCNKWAPGQLSQVKDAVADKPVVILAVSTDTPPAQAKEYMQRAGMIGPNIFHGYEPQIAKSFGFTSEFFNYAIIDPAGNVAQWGVFGATMATGANEGQPVVAYQLERSKDLGKFRFIDPKMSDDLQNVLWPMELGNVTGLQAALNKAKKSLKGSDRELLDTTVDRFVVEELDTAFELSMGEPAEKIEALEKATFLSNNFKATKQGKEAKKLLADLTKDKTLKKELSAKKMYELSMQSPDLDRRVALLEKAAKQFPDTHYGLLAEKAAAAAKQ